MLDQLLAGRDPQDLFAKDGLLDELKKALPERMLTAELDDHLASESEEGGANRRNGSSRKTMLTGTLKVTLDVPRDRAGTFDPKLIAKYQRRFPDFDDKIRHPKPILEHWLSRTCVNKCGVAKNYQSYDAELGRISRGEPTGRWTSTASR